MGQKRIIAEMRKRDVSEEVIQGYIKDYDKKAKANLAREEVYLQTISKNSLQKIEAYENRKLIKAGLRESYRQRKNRLNKERRAAFCK